MWVTAKTEEWDKTVRKAIDWRGIDGRSLKSVSMAGILAEFESVTCPHYSWLDRNRQGSNWTQEKGGVIISLGMHAWMNRVPLFSVWLRSLSCQTLQWYFKIYFSVLEYIESRWRYHSFEFKWLPAQLLLMAWQLLHRQSFSHNL